MSFLLFVLWDITLFFMVVMGIVYCVYPLFDPYCSLRQIDETFWFGIV